MSFYIISVIFDEMVNGIISENARITNPLTFAMSLGSSFNPRPDGLGAQTTPSSHSKCLIIHFAATIAKIGLVICRYGHLYISQWLSMATAILWTLSSDQNRKILIWAIT